MGAAPRRSSLRKHFGDDAIRFEVITPERVRRFFAAQAKNYKAPTSLGAVVAALRGYFRWRATLGDRTHALVGALAYPANWQLASLPKSLEPAEVEQLEAALGQSGPSMLRADAMVRCMLDLGLRSGEVARLSMDDIDWDASTITLRRTKGRREDVMPLPEATGQAIAAYLRSERPKTQHRMVFARHMTPRERPIGPDLVRKTIRQAYARAGLPHTRSHLLRHTMASRLLAGGASLKEVADVLRHRSLNTTLIYAKLDSGSLVEVALPWPGIPQLPQPGGHHDHRPDHARRALPHRTPHPGLPTAFGSLQPAQPGRVRPAHAPPRTSDPGGHGRVGASGLARKRRSADLGPAPQATALLRAMDAAVRAGHRGARRHDLRSAARAPGAAHLQPRGSAAVAGSRA
jgi:site-specific recombinase XerD